MNRLTVWAFAAALACAPRVAGAQAAQSTVQLTLEDAVRRAVEQSPRLEEARAREAAAEATTTARHAGALPSVTAAAGYVRINHVTPFGLTPINGTVSFIFPDIPNNYSIGAQLDYALYNAGRVTSLVKAAQSEALATSADRRVIDQDTKLEAIRAYWSLVTARESVVVLERGLERTDAYVREARSRVEVGVVSPSDVLTAQAQRARQAVGVVQARNAAAAAEIELARIIGVEGQSIATLTDVTTPTKGIESVMGQSTDALLARASKDSAELEALAYRADAPKATAVAALATMKPMLNALASVAPTSPNPRFVPRTDAFRTSWDLGITMTWQLFDGGRARADYAAALAQSDAFTARRRETSTVLAAQVRQSMLDLDSNRAALTASDEAVAAATEARRVLEERYRAGVATNVEVLDAQVAQLEAELERTMLAAALRLSEARMLRTLGGL